MLVASSWRFTTSGGADISVGEGVAFDIGGGNFYVTDDNDSTQTVYRLPYYCVGGGPSAGTPIGFSSSDSDALGSGIGRISYNDEVLSRNLVLGDFGGFCAFVTLSGSIAVVGGNLMIVTFGYNTACITDPSFGVGQGLVWGTTAATPGVSVILNVGYINVNGYSVASQSYAPPPVDSSYQAPPAPVSF